MKRKNFDEKFLWWSLIINLIVVFTIICRKPPIKDWLLVYLFNALTNGIIDSFLSAYKIVKYPVRFFPKVFKTHILFDFLIYPTFTILYNQMTKNDKLFTIFYKLFYFTIPMFLVEFWAVKRTGLIKWNKGWKWYHTLMGVTLKSFSTRLFIGGVRKIEKKQEMRMFRD
ncbi:CBO0543 family protein [Niallia sp. NCCP-28]|uniref:CBO0543 family protein n=1 Tax=Niallia sp. NCCP-28 TaxID=2934712 RepID=UPI00207DC378|nr:CBO0543 family protein [Niallia sp. NCCP-28]GKU84865.1 hypothetical protein NCCP28_42610 [Niallia sp. NCCP-28]